MSYRAIQIHWVVYQGETKISDEFSYHLSEDDAKEFIARECARFSEGHHNLNGHLGEYHGAHISPGGRGFVPISGELYNALKHSRNGLWYPTFN